MLYFPLLLFFCYFLWFSVSWYLFLVFVFMCLDSSLCNQEHILTCLLSFWLIIKSYYHYYGSIILYDSIFVTNSHYSRLFYLIISLLFIWYCLYYSIFTFIFSLLLVLRSPFIFCLISYCICCFISYFRYCIYFSFYHFSREISWAKNVR